MGGKVLKSAENTETKAEEEVRFFWPKEDDSIVGVLAKRLQRMNVMVADSNILYNLRWRRFRKRGRMVRLTLICSSLYHFNNL